MNIVRFDLKTLLPIGVYDSPLPPYQTQLDVIEKVAPDSFSLEDDMFSLYLDGMNVGNDYATALLLAKSRAVDWVRNIVEGILSESDIRVRVCREHLTIDRSDEVAIEKYYNVLADRKQVRDSSNEAQELINQCVSPNVAWNIANNFNPRSAAITSPAPEITKNAFQQRLNLSIQEKSDPVFQALTSDLLALGYVDLRQAESELNFLAQIRKLSAERVSNILSAPIQWRERPVHGV
jgi:hypothetical protein